MQKDWITVVAALFAVLLIGTASLLSQASPALYSQFEVPTPITTCGWVDTTGWNTYENERYGFQIKYPHDFTTTEHDYEHVTSGAVVTFVPTFDPSIDRAGAKTNLFDFSVTIGVTEYPMALLKQNVSCLARTHECRLDGLREVGSIRFARYYYGEGAVGNRYEKLSYRAACGGTRYEIALFIHSGNPDCYSPGAITIFDPAEILHLLDTMVGTFLTPNKDCYVSN